MDNATHLGNSTGKQGGCAGSQLLCDQCATIHEEQQLTSEQQLQQCLLKEGESIQAFNNCFNELLKNCNASGICVSHCTQLPKCFCALCHHPSSQSNSSPLKASLSKASLSLHSKHRAIDKDMKKSSFPLLAKCSLSNQSAGVLPHHFIEMRKGTTDAVKTENGRHLPMQFPLRRRTMWTQSVGTVVNLIT